MLDELSPNLMAEVKQAAELLAAPARLCILTGAGISAESGIPTFRDKQTGLWEQYRAEDLASYYAFEKDPQLVWSWYQWRRQLVKDKTPNPAHRALADWQQRAAQNEQQLTLITQNVDDLHEQAGSEVTHLHGHLWRNRCSQCNKPFDITKHARKQSQTTSSASSNDKANIVDATEGKNNTGIYSETLIRCDHCGGFIRPDIVWFGEALPTQEWQVAEQAAATCDVFISIGTSSLVYPAAGLAQLAQQNGAKIIEINPNPSPNMVVDITLAEKAGIVVPLLLKQIEQS